MFKLKSTSPLAIALVRAIDRGRSEARASRGLCTSVGTLVVGATLVFSTGELYAQAAEQDTGDAPGTYGNAIHGIVLNAPYMGDVPPDAGSGVPGIGANSDDQSNPPTEVDDEDGVSAFPDLVENQKAFTTNVFVTNPSTVPANLVGWVDFNGNGVFETTEAATAVVPAGVVNEKVKLLWNNLEGITTTYVGTSYARFRITTDDLTAQMSTGSASDGEVEDYELTIERDIDGDEIPDNQDPDNDNDGIPDAIDGIGVDFDNDSIENYLDTDSDGDQIPDFIEAGPNPQQPIDTDGNGDPDFLDLDSNNDGTPDSELVTGDLDGDGITGADEGLGDTDLDGIANTSDLDTDNDTIPDAIEGTVDSDGDGVPDFLDLDSDNDGIPDVRESGYDPAVIGYLDTDGDYRVDPTFGTGANGLADIVETSPDNGLLFYALADTDGDGVRDYLDRDSDGDGEPDLTETGGNDADGDGRVDVLADTNGNGVVDSVDAELLGGPDQDGDSIIDTADIDFVPGEEDDDEDGVIDSADPDADGNGIADGQLNQLQSDGSLPDVDGDGLSQPDYLDGANAIDNSTGNNGNGGDGNGNGGNGQTADGPIETGLQGVAGCSIGDGNAPFDPSLPLLASLSMLWLALRRRFSR